MFGDQERGKGSLGGQEQNRMIYLERDLSLSKVAIDEKQWMLAATKSG